MKLLSLNKNTMFRLLEFQSLTVNQNFRPLMFNGTFIESLLADPNFNEICFYLVNLKNQNISKQISTIRYVLFDKDKKPYFFDGIKISKINTKHLKKAGLDVNSDLSNTSFVIPKEEFEIILNHLKSPVDSSGHIPALNTQYVIFAISGYPNYTIHYEIIKGWFFSGGGPGGRQPQTPAY